MRILMITDFYWPFLGGVEQHVRTLSHALQQRGHQVAVATLWNEGLPEEEIDSGVSVFRLRSSTQRANWLYSERKRPWAPPFSDPEVTLALRRIIKREQPQIVHGHDWLARSYLPLKEGNPAKFVVSLHYYTRTCAKKNLMRAGAPCSGPAFFKCLSCGANHYGAAKGTVAVLANWAAAAFESTTADMFISVTQATAAGNGLPATHLPQAIVPNFLPPTDTPTNTEEQATLDSYLAQLPDEEFMLFVGDLRPMKGLDVLLRAYEALRAERQERREPTPPLVLIGKEWPDTPGAFPPNTRVLHNWPNAAVMEAWRRSSIALVPSVWAEPFGIVVIEAMAGGSPVIASCVGGIPEIIVDGESGLLVPPGDVEALAAAMTRLINNPALRQRMGNAAKARAAHYEASAVVPRIEAIYQRLLTE